MSNLNMITPLTVQGIINKFCYTIGMLPTSYKQSLTYEEQLLAIGNYLESTVYPAINNNAQALAELQTLFAALQDYVNNYFDNLDVATEINNKLDSMYQDGSLKNLIGQYIDNDVMPIINAQTAEITQFKNETNDNFNNLENNVESSINSMENQINALVDNSPVIVNDTSEMTNTSKIYVNITDGKWYYYNGTAWTIGGTYQSTGIGNGQIGILMLDEALQSNFNYDIGENLVSQQINSVYYSKNSSGKVQSTNANNYASYIYPLEIGKTYFFTGFNRYTTKALLIADSEDNVIYETSATDTSTVCGASYLFNVQQSGLKAYVNRVATTSQSAWQDYYMTRLSLVNKIYNNLNIKSSISSINILENTYLDKRDLAENATVKFRTAENYNSKIYKISKGLKYTINSYNVYYVPGICLTDNSYNLKYLSIENYTATAESVTYTFTSEFDGFAILPTINSPSVQIDHSITLSYDAIKADNLLNNLSNKKVLWNGDSIAYGAGNSGISYANYIATKYNMNSTNYAVSGRCIAKEAGQTSILETIDSMESTADFVIFEGGWNDMWRVQLGTISEGYDAELDEYTWTGALESMIKKLKVKYPTGKTAFILAHGRVDSERTREDTFWNRAIEVFDKWNFPYLDLRHNGLCAFNNTLLDLFFQINNETGHGDGTHPNALGYQTFYNNQIAQFMNTL